MIYVHIDGRGEGGTARGAGRRGEERDMSEEEDRPDGNEEA